MVEGFTDTRGTDAPPRAPRELGGHVWRVHAPHRTGIRGDQVRIVGRYSRQCGTSEVGATGRRVARKTLT